MTAPIMATLAGSRLAQGSTLPGGVWDGLLLVTSTARGLPSVFCNQQRVLKDHLYHGRSVNSGGKAASVCVLEVKGKGGVGGTGSDVHQVVILLILEELAIGLADAELRGGANAQHAVQSHRA